jgi:hypothetical protein
MQLVQITRFIASRIAQNCLNCWKLFSGWRAPIPRTKGPSSSKARVISVHINSICWFFLAFLWFIGTFKVCKEFLSILYIKIYHRHFF